MGAQYLPSNVLILISLALSILLALISWNLVEKNSSGSEIIPLRGH